MGISLEKAFGIHEVSLRLRNQRNELLASNVANSETPNYKARDIDFDQALRQSMASAGDQRLKATHKGHISNISATGISSEYVKYRVPHQPSLDGNTVETHIEQAAFSKSAVEYQATLKFLEGRVSGLMKALTGD